MTELNEAVRAAERDDDEYDDSVRELAAGTFGIAVTLAAEVMYVNDDGYGHSYDETPEQRWQRVRRWVGNQLDKGRR